MDGSESALAQSFGCMPSASTMRVSSLYIDGGDPKANDEIFNQLLKERQAIETAFGDPLEWQPLPGRRSCRVRRSYKGVGYRDPEKWADVIPVLVDAMTRLEKAASPYLGKGVVRDIPSISAEPMPDWRV